MSEYPELARQIFEHLVGLRRLLLVLARSIPKQNWG